MVLGLDTNLQKGEDKDTHDMIQATRGLLARFNNFVFIILTVAFPFTAPFLRVLGYSLLNSKQSSFLKQCFADIIHQRDQLPQEAMKRVDFLQQMMDLRVSPGEQVTDGEDESGGAKACKKLTEEEVLAQVFQMFLAGSDTTTNALGYLIYCLATHLDVQEKVHHEILTVVGQGEVTYEQLQQFKYLDCVILETLRMYPVMPTVTRLSERAMDVKGYHIPQGMCITLALYTATHDPDLYPDPFTVNPDRFADGKDSFLASLPFGAGPRQCIAMRLALHEMKTAAIHACRAVRFVPCDKTPKTLEFVSIQLLVPKKPIIVRAEIRT
ncbi:hypothetical protein ACOMHN_021792 [Nucella lapillus]